MTAENPREIGLQESGGRNRWYFQQSSGSVSSILPDDPEHVLMQSWIAPDERIGTRLGSTDEGLALVKININNGRRTQIWGPKKTAAAVYTDAMGEPVLVGYHGDRRSGEISGLLYFKLVNGLEIAKEQASEPDAFSFEGTDPSGELRLLSRS